MAQYLRSVSLDSMVVGRIYSMQTFGTLNDISMHFSSERHDSLPAISTLQGDGRTESLVAHDRSQLARSNSWDVDLTDPGRVYVACSRNPRESSLSAEQLQYVGNSRPRSFAFIASEKPSTASSTRRLHSRPVYVVQSSVIHSVSKWKYLQWRLKRAWNALRFLW